MTPRPVTINSAPPERRAAFDESIRACRPDMRIAGQLWTCVDAMPDDICTRLDLPVGATYAKGARAIVGMNPMSRRRKLTPDEGQRLGRGGAGGI
jgi:hypothetical protein